MNNQVLAGVHIAATPARRLRTWHVAVITALVGTIAYYLPLIGALEPGHAHWPGFMLTADQRLGFFPSFVEGYRRFWHGGLLGIDFFTDDGAGVFAYRPNLMPFYPPFLLAYLLVDCSDLRTGMLAFVVMNVAHQFVGLYFTVVFVRRYLRMPSGAAVLTATVYGLTWYASAYSGEATFYFQMMLLPVAACALCWLTLTRSLLAPILMSPVFAVIALSNYAPTMLASLALAAVAALIAFLLADDRRGHPLWRSLVPPLASMILAFLACAPYFYAQLKFKGLIAATADDIDPVAHDLSFTAYDLLNGFSQFMAFHRTNYESILVWGALPTFVCLFGLDVAITRQGSIKSRYLNVSGIAALVYVMTLLPTFGTTLISATDAFYYLVPFLGKMHLYQRYLMFSNFFFSIAVGGLATIAAVYASPAAKRVAAYLGIAIWVAVTVLCLIWRPAAPTDTDRLLIEVFLMAAGAVVMAATPPRVALPLVAVCCALPGLFIAYAIPSNTNRLSIWTAEPDPLGPEIPRLIDFVKSNNGDRALAKIVVASSSIIPYFNRNLPWLVGKHVPLMNFQGYPMHLAVMADYAGAFGAYGNFSLPWLQATGADFIYWDDAAVLKPFNAGGYTIGPTLDFPGGHHFGKLTLDAASQPLLRLLPDNVALWPKAMQLDDWRIEDGRLVKSTNRESQFGYSAAQTPGTTYEVAFDVVADTPGHLRIAFASQVLPGLDAVGSSHYAQRVTSSSIGDLWITASASFNGSLSRVTVTPVDKNSEEDANPQAGFDNGILRVSGPEGAVTGFGTDYTQRVSLVLDSPTPRTITYLLWPNPYVVPYLDGQQTSWTNPSARPLSVDVEPGRHTFDIRFKSLSGRVFLWAQLAYVILVGMALVLAFARRPAFAPLHRRLRSAFR